MKFDPLFSRVTIQLWKREGSNLGVTVAGGSDKGKIPVIASIKSGSIADRSDALLVGDHILSINDIKTSELQHEEIVQLTKYSGPSLRLEIQYELPDNLVLIQGGLQFRPRIGLINTPSGSRNVTMQNVSLTVSSELQSTLDENNFLESKAMWDNSTTAPPNCLIKRTRINLSSDGSNLRANGGFGFTVRGGWAESVLLSRPITIMQIRPGGPAERDGRIKPGDRILAINNIRLTTMTCEETMALISQASQYAQFAEGSKEYHTTESATSNRLTIISLLVEYNITNIEGGRDVIGSVIVEIEKAPYERLGIALAPCHEISTGENAFYINRIRLASIADRSGALMIGDRIEAIDDVRVSHMSLQEAMHRIRHNRLDFVRLRLVPLAINILPNQDLGSYDTRTAKHMTGSKNSGIMDASEERNAFISCLTVSEQPASVDIIQNKTINIEEAQKMKRNKESSVEDNFDMIAMKGDDEKENIEYEEHAKGIENREEEIGYANRFDQVEHVLKKQWQEIRAQEDIDIETMADPRFVQQPSLDYKSIQPKRQTRKKSSNVPKMSLEPSLQQFTSTEHCSCHHISSTLPASGKELLYSKQPLNSRGQSADEESIKHRKKSNERHKNFKTGSASATSLTITSTPCVHTSEEFQIDLLSESEARSSRTGLQQRGLLSAQKSMDNKVCREHEITAISLAEKGKSSISHHPDEQMPGILVSNQITSRSYTKHYANSEKQEADLGHSMAPLGHVIRKPQSESGHSNGLLKQNYKGITKSMTSLPTDSASPSCLTPADPLAMSQPTVEHSLLTHPTMSEKHRNTHQFHSQKMHYKQMQMDPNNFDFSSFRYDMIEVCLRGMDPHRFHAKNIWHSPKRIKEAYPYAERKNEGSNANSNTIWLDNPFGLTLKSSKSREKIDITSDISTAGRFPFIDYVVPGGPAYLSGVIQAGDRLLSINGESTLGRSVEELTARYFNFSMSQETILLDENNQDEDRVTVKKLKTESKAEEDKEERDENGKRRKKKERRDKLDDFLTQQTPRVIGERIQVPLSAKSMFPTLKLVIQYSIAERLTPESGTFNVRIIRCCDSLGINLQTSLSKHPGAPLLISKVIPGGVASRCGVISPGDLLLAVDGVPLSTCSLAEAIHLLQSPQKESVLLTIEKPQAFKTPVKSMQPLNSVSSKLESIRHEPGIGEPGLIELGSPRFNVSGTFSLRSINSSSSLSQTSIPSHSVTPLDRADEEKSRSRRRRNRSKNNLEKNEKRSFSANQEMPQGDKSMKVSDENIFDHETENVEYQEYESEDDEANANNGVSDSDEKEEYEVEEARISSCAENESSFDSEGVDKEYFEEEEDEDEEEEEEGVKQEENLDDGNDEEEEQIQNDETEEDEEELENLTSKRLEEIHFMLDMQNNRDRLAEISKQVENMFYLKDDEECDASEQEDEDGLEDHKELEIKNAEKVSANEMITKENKEISVVASQNEIELGESFEGEKNEVQIELDFLSHHVETAEFGRRTDKKKILRSTDDQRGYPAELKEEPGTTNSRRSLDTLRHSTPVCSVQVDLLGEEKSQMDQKEISLSDKKCLLLHSGSNLPQVSKDLQNSFGLQRNLTEQLAEVQNQRHQHKQSCHLRVQNDQTKIMSGQQISRVQLKKEQQHPRYPRKIHKESKSDTATTHKSGPPINTPTSYSHSTPFSREKPLYSRDEQERLEYIEAQEDENLNFIRDRSSNCLLRVHPMQPHGSRLPTFDSVDSRPHVDKLQLLNTDTAPLISLKLDSIIQAKSAEDSENFMQHLDGYDLAGYNRPTQSCSTKDERERWRRSGAQVFHQGEHRPPKQPQGQPFSVNSVLPKQRSSTLPTLLNAATNATGGASYQLVEKSGRWEPGDICQELGQRGSKTRQACQDRSELYIKSLRNSPKRMALEVQKSGRQGQAQTNQMCRPRISKQERDKATKPEGAAISEAQSISDGRSFQSKSKAEFLSVASRQAVITAHSGGTSSTVVLTNHSGFTETIDVLRVEVVRESQGCAWGIVISGTDDAPGAPILIDSLTPGDPGAASGQLRPGDRILAVNGTPVHRGYTLSQAMLLLQQYPDRVILHVARRRNEQEPRSSGDKSRENSAGSLITSGWGISTEQSSSLGSNKSIKAEMTETARRRSTLKKVAASTTFNRSFDSASFSPGAQMETIELRKAASSLAPARQTVALTSYQSQAQSLSPSMSTISAVDPDLIEPQPWYSGTSITAAIDKTDGGVDKAMRNQTTSQYNQKMVDEEKPPSAQHTQGTSSQFFQPVSGGNSRLDGDSHSSHSGLMAPPGSYYYYPQGSQVLLRPPSPPPASPNGPPVRVPKIPHPTSIPVSQGPVKRRKKVAAQQRLVVPSSGRASGILAGQSGRPRVRVIKAQPGMLDLLGNEESQAGQQFWTADKPTIRESHGVEPPRRRLHVDKDKTPQIMSEKISSLVQPHSQPESVNEEEKASSGDGSRGHSGIRLSTVNIEAGRPTIPVSKQHPDRLLGNATSMGRKSNQRSELDFSAIHCPGCREAIANELRTEQRLRQRQSQAGDMTRIGAFTVKENDKVRTCRRKATVERLEKESWDEIDLGRMEEKRMEKRTKDASFTPATMEESRVKQTGYEQQSLPSGIEVEPLHCKRKSKRKQETQSGLLSQSHSFDSSLTSCSPIKERTHISPLRTSDTSLLQKSHRCNSNFGEMEDEGGAITANNEGLTSRKTFGQRHSHQSRGSWQRNSHQQRHPSGPRINKQGFPSHTGSRRSTSKLLATVGNGEGGGGLRHSRSDSQLDLVLVSSENYHVVSRSDGLNTTNAAGEIAPTSKNAGYWRVAGRPDRESHGIRSTGQYPATSGLELSLRTRSREKRSMASPAHSRGQALADEMQIGRARELHGSSVVLRSDSRGSCSDPANSMADITINSRGKSSMVSNTPSRGRKRHGHSQPRRNEYSQTPPATTGLVAILGELKSRISNCRQGSVTATVSLLDRQKSPPAKQSEEQRMAGTVKRSEKHRLAEKASQNAMGHLSLSGKSDAQARKRLPNKGTVVPFTPSSSTSISEPGWKELELHRKETQPTEQQRNPLSESTKLHGESTIDIWIRICRPEMSANACFPDSGSFGIGVSEGLSIPGIFVSAIRANSPADKSEKLHLYDRIMQVNDSPTIGLSCREVVGLISRSDQFVDLLIERQISFSFDGSTAMSIAHRHSETQHHSSQTNQADDIPGRQIQIKQIKQRSQPQITNPHGSHHAMHSSSQRTRRLENRGPNLCPSQSFNDSVGPVFGRTGSQTQDESGAGRALSPNFSQACISNRAGQRNAGASGRLESDYGQHDGEDFRREEASHSNERIRLTSHFRRSISQHRVGKSSDAAKQELIELSQDVPLLSSSHLYSSRQYQLKQQQPLQYRATQHKQQEEYPSIVPQAILQADNSTGHRYAQQSHARDVPVSSMPYSQDQHQRQLQHYSQMKSKSENLTRSSLQPQLISKSESGGKCSSSGRVVQVVQGKRGKTDRRPLSANLVTGYKDVQRERIGRENEDERRRQEGDEEKEESREEEDTAVNIRLPDEAWRARNVSMGHSAPGQLHHTSLGRKKLEKRQDNS